eukprot:g713.t1
MFLFAPVLIGGEITIFVQLQNDHQQPFSGSTREGDFTTGAVNYVVLNIPSALRRQPEFAGISQIVAGGRKARNPRQRQEWLVQAHHALSTVGFVTDVVTSTRVVEDVNVKVFIVNRCSDGPKGNEDMGFFEHKNLATLSYALKDFVPTMVGKDIVSFNFSYNLNAQVRDETSAIAMAAEVDAALKCWETKKWRKAGKQGSKKDYDSIAKRYGMHYSNVWATGNQEEGIEGLQWLGPHHFNVERIYDVRQWLPLRSWYEFEGLMDDSSQLLWGYFWLTSMIPKVGGYDESQMKLLRTVTRLFMLQYEQLEGIASCSVTYGKYLFRPEWLMKHGIETYNDECQSDNICKFLMDDLRRLKQNGNASQTMVKTYLQQKLLARVKYVVNGECAVKELAGRTESVLCPSLYMRDAFGFIPATASAVQEKLLQLTTNDIRFYNKLLDTNMHKDRFFDTME